ncbi:hypothetical protein N657DRAFT_643341 [Parathielavia appendiculata]|uniref:Uncharacterized protein n=1 Tax=Parathielavia appendiculata TaxID=2587402 RepID=A0AAN6U5K3_9PEZI|nr:hypothetical protein N657DRAFT_643341 [Parathielavia appendiculata]
MLSLPGCCPDHDAPMAVSRFQPHHPPPFIASPNMALECRSPVKSSACHARERRNRPSRLCRGPLDDRGWPKQRICLSLGKTSPSTIGEQSTETMNPWQGL